MVVVSPNSTTASIDSGIVTVINLATGTETEGMDSSKSLVKPDPPSTTR